LIIPNSVVGGVLCVPVWHRHPTHLFLLFCLLVLWGAGVEGVIERGIPSKGFA